MRALSDQAIGQAHRLDCFAVVNRADFDAGLLLEVSKNWLGIDLVLSAIGDDFGPGLVFEARCGQHRGREQRDRTDEPPPLRDEFLLPELFDPFRVEKSLHGSFRGLAPTAIHVHPLRG